MKTWILSILLLLSACSHSPAAKKRQVASTPEFSQFSSTLSASSSTLPLSSSSITSTKLSIKDEAKEYKHDMITFLATGKTNDALQTFFDKAKKEERQFSPMSNENLATFFLTQEEQ